MGVQPRASPWSCEAPMKAKYILLPALALFVTLCADFVAFFGDFIALMSRRGMIPFGQQPVWIQACLQQPALLRKAVLLSLAVAVTGPLLTIWLLLKTEAPKKARLHFKNLGVGILIGAVLGFLLPLSIMALTFARAAFSPQGLAQLGSMTNFARTAFEYSVVAGLGFGVFALIGLAAPYALFTLVSRARQPSLLPQNTGQEPKLPAFRP